MVFRGVHVKTRGFYFYRRERKERKDRRALQKNQENEARWALPGWLTSAKATVQWGRRAGREGRDEVLGKMRD